MTAADMAPGDVRAAVEAMLAGEWGVVDAADGFMLLAKARPDKTLPAEFYTFAVTQQGAAAGDGGCAAVWQAWRRTTGRAGGAARWRRAGVGEGFGAATMAPRSKLRTPSGETLYRFADAMPAL